MSVNAAFSPAVTLDLDEPLAAVDGAEATSTRGDLVRELQERVRGMQRIRLDSRSLPTSPGIAELLPGGSLSAGSAYAVEGSTTLALSLLQGPSAAGAWCAVVGLPDLGIEAAAGLGIDLDRLVLVPRPGGQWVSVISALIDVVTVVLVHPGQQRVSDAVASRLAARLRQREAVLVSVGGWPGNDVRLSVTGSSWNGVGAGHGYLTERSITVASESRSWAGQAKSRRLRWAS
ncbi:MAG: hypothetical protein JWP75_1101 [Frondihabitans sp.]|nr:hypothetical protein [Frondihabitans sp.]